MKLTSHASLRLAAAAITLAHWRTTIDGCGVLVPAVRRVALAAHGYGPEPTDLWRI
jgi:hypothetical protein